MMERILKYFCAILPAVFCVTLINGCAVKEAEPPAPRHAAAERQGAIIIDPSSFYEACEKLTPGQQIEYSFEASLPVNFNIHYHSKADGIVYPVKEDTISSKSGGLTAEVQAVYCCMWSNKHAAPVTLSHEFNIVAQ
jgi:hypothetical protein